MRPPLPHENNETTTVTNLLNMPYNQLPESPLLPGRSNCIEHKTKITNRRRSKAANTVPLSAVLVQSETAYHRCQQRCSRNECLEQNGFVVRMSAFPHCSHSIQRRNPQRGGEIPIGPPARRCFL
jgi:hypothetical protein